ncbi:MFS transporter [Bacillus salipaludis]|uniref:MFS transporter n=1 Tax=Bacillus salipaludis TaxID=2547811 RepID=A0A4R5VKC3_9BACI|nr:MFS transporter [Bacillus salipaludis]MDQ6598803.1 MFS transporter [Bacillus salipaludis]TDK56263.1 MFS transporter [Bacillus salipaludis]
MKSGNGKILLGLSIAAFMGPFTQTIYTPSLGEVGHYYHASQFMVNLTISLYTFVLATNQFLVGPLADTRGRRATLLPGLLIFIVGSLICFLSPNYYLFLFGRALQAFGITTGSVVAAAVIGDLYPPKERGKAMSVYQTMVFLGPVLGPVVGSFIAASADWHTAFAVLAAGALFAYFYNRVILPETLSKETAPRKITIQTFLGILTNRAAFSVLLLGFVQFYGYYIYLVFIPGLLDELFQVPLAVKGLFFLPLTAGIVIGSLVGGKLQSFMRHTSILIYTAYGIGIVVTVFWVCLHWGLLNIPSLIVLLLFYGVMLGMSLPSQSTSLVNLFAKEKGTAMGVYNFVRFTGAAIGPLLGSALFKLGGDDALYITLFLFLLCGAVVIQKSSRANEELHG